jgi:uncharacterized protein YbjT (DUF2867 family)
VEDFGGPEVLSARRIVDVWRAQHGRPRAVVNLRAPGRTSRALHNGLNTTPEHADGRETWDQFVRSRE